MTEENKEMESKPDPKISDKADELIGKSKEFADKAEDFLADKARELKDSDVFEKIIGLFGKVEDFMEDKSREFQSGEMGAKFDAFKGKAENQAGELIKKAKEAGRKIGDQIDDTIDAFKGKKGPADNQNGGGI